MSNEEIKNALIEKYCLSQNDASRIAYLADGKYNIALKLVTENENQEGNFYLHNFREWMRMCFKVDIVSMVSWAEDIAKIGREKQKEFLSYGLSIIRECLIRIYGDNTLLRVDGEEKDFVNKFSTRLDGNICKQLSDEFSEAILHIERNGNAKLIFMDLSLKCMRIVKQNVPPIAKAKI
jgi:DNA polymerase-3 subunit delta'